MARGVLPCLEGILQGKAHGGSSPSCPLPLRLHTCPNDLLDLDICRIHLPGKFSDGLAGVLVRGRVDVILHPKPCRQMGYVMRVRYEARLPTHPRHALLRRQAEEPPWTLGEPSLACCAQPPALPPLATLYAAASFSDEQVLARASLRLHYGTCHCFCPRIALQRGSEVGTQPGPVYLPPRNSKVVQKFGLCEN